MKQPEWHDSNYGCHMPQEPLKLFQWYLPLKELRQFSTAWACSSVKRAVIPTESNSTPRKEILCTGESLLFSQLTRSLNWLRCRSTKSLWSHNCSLDWANIGQSSRELGTLMPTSRSGVSALSTTFIKAQGDRESPRGRILYCYAQPSNANRRNGLCRRRIETWMEVSFRSIAANQSWGWMHLIMRLHVNILNGSLCKARFKTRRSRMGRWPPF